MSSDGEDDERTHATLPKADFIKDVEAYIAGSSVEEAIQKLRQHHELYTAAQQRLTSQRARFMQKGPEIKATLSAVQLLMRQREKQETATFDFELTEEVFVKAKVEPVDAVNLWLGANVMLEYTLEDAAHLLETNLNVCQESLKNTESSLDLIKDFLTTTEVNIARLYNYEVLQRKHKKDDS
ncbi:hypothetical protein WJX84_009037 [Apatococcus fuscideae]|uniref:Prefoldin subunit 3 n=1 Tax=Apatococcus fuscideae TaxID=2026836 RepID=A0AAW1RTY7_9CHLO